MSCSKHGIVSIFSMFSTVVPPQPSTAQFNVTYKRKYFLLSCFSSKILIIGLAGFYASFQHHCSFKLKITLKWAWLGLRQKWYLVASDKVICQ